MFVYGIARVMALRRSKQELHPVHVLAGFGIPIFSTLLLILGILSIAINPWFILGLLGAILLCCLLTIIVVSVNTGSLVVGLDMPLVLAIFFLAWSSGFIKEMFWPTKPNDRTKISEKLMET